MQMITALSQAHIDALQAHRDVATATSPLTQAERECVGSGLLEIDGWDLRTTPAGFAVLAAVILGATGALKAAVQA